MRNSEQRLNLRRKEPDAHGNRYAPDNRVVEIEPLAPGDVLNATLRSNAATIEELEVLRSERTPAGLHEDIFAHGLLGFGDAVRVISMMGRQVSLLEALRASVAVFASVRAIWSGESAVQEILDKYDGLINQIASAPGSTVKGVANGQVAAAPSETPQPPDGN